MRIDDSSFRREAAFYGTETNRARLLNPLKCVLKGKALREKTLEVSDYFTEEHRSYTAGFTFLSIQRG